MSLTSIAAIAATGFMIAFLHAALPTHWLPFVLVGRAQGWGPRRVLATAGAAGSGHVLVTAALGLVLTIAGLALQPRLGGLFPKAVGAVLVLIGLFYLARQALHHGHGHAIPGATPRGCSDWAATLGLIAILTFSPCEALLPVYLANARYGLSGFVVLSLVLAGGTALAMLLFTGLCLAGADRLRLERLAGYEAAVIGVALCALGLFTALESGA